MKLKCPFALTVVCFLLFSASSVPGQSKNHMFGKDIAVFYPAEFDSTRTLPSLALIEEPAPTGPVPSDWPVKPCFYQEKGNQLASIAFQEGTDLYGTGEVTGPLRRNGQEVELWNTDNYGYEKAGGKRLYQSHPWILGVREDGSSFGILVDHTWRQKFQLNNPIRIISKGPPFRIIIVEKDNPQEVMKSLGDLTGTMPLPPLWALGYQQSRHSYFPQSHARGVADTLRQKDIPCDVLWLDIEYMDDYKIFTFDEKRFPDPEGLNEDLHKLDFKAVWMIDPGVKKEKGYHVYDSGDAGNHWVLDKKGKEFNGKVWPGQCAFPDYTRPKTREWWAGLYDGFMQRGIDGIWNDMNEPSVFDGPESTMPDDNIHRGGGALPRDSHLRYHNVYGMLMVKASREGMLEVRPDERPFILSRANFLGGQRYAATWTGDNKSTWAHLEMSIPMSLNLSLSGQPFNGPDIGGFVGDADGELLAHWTALGAFYPFSRNHTGMGSARQEPWSFGKKVENIARNAIERRYKLMPYLYTLFREASQTGMPIMRPLFFADPDDPRLRDEQEAFLLGGNMMVVPRWSEDPDLPEGKWRNVPVIEKDSTFDQYQPRLKVKPGSVIPVGPVIQSTEDYSTDSLTLVVSLNDKGQATGTLYDDAGNNFNYKKGEYLLSWFHAQKTTAKKARQASAKDTVLKVEIRHKAGKWALPEKTYRIELLTDQGTFYSKWQTGDQITMAWPFN